MSFRITGLAPEPFQHLYGKSDDELAALGVKRYVVDAKPGFPDRVEMRDLEPGETALLLNYEHLPVDSPYRSRHAIFVREGASEAYDRSGEVPEVMRVRPLSLRGFDANGMMLDAALAEGDEVESAIRQMLANPEIAYIQAHNAVRGCYSGRIERA